MLLQRKEREAPKWELREKKLSSARAVHHHPKNTTTGERTSFAYKNITRFIQIRAFRSRSTFATGDGSGAKHHHFCASFSPVRVRAAFPKREKERTGAQKPPAFFANERSPLSLSIRTRARFFFRECVTTQRDREGYSCARVETYHDKFFYSCARKLLLRIFVCGNVVSQKKTKRGRKQRREVKVIDDSSWGVIQSADFDSFSEKENRERERKRERVRPRSVFLRATRRVCERHERARHESNAVKWNEKKRKKNW